MIVLSIGSSAPKSRSAASQPRIATCRPASNSLGVIGRPRSIVRRRQADVFLGDAADLNAVERLAAVLDLRRRAGLRHHQRDVRARTRGSPSASSSVTRGLLCARSCSSSRAASMPVRLHRERVGAELRLDRVLDARVQALDERHHGDDRRDRDDVAEHGQQRAQLVRPDGLQARSLAASRNCCISVPLRRARGRSSRRRRCGRVTFTASPSFSVRAPTRTAR